MPSRRSFALTALALTLGAGLAQAQPRPHGGHQPSGYQPRPSGPARPAPSTHRPAAPHAARPGPPPHAQSSQRPGPHRPNGPRRGAGPDRRFHRGDRLPADYRRHQYVVNNWRTHRLSPPPRGHHWIQIGADYALIAVATGIIAQIVLSH